MKLLLLLLLLVPGLASAQALHGFTFTWEDPVEREDGMELDPDEELELYRMRCVRENGGAEAETDVLRADTEAVEGVTRTYFWQDAVQRGGWYECQMLVADTEGLESDWSNVASVRKMARPMPPGQMRGN